MTTRPSGKSRFGRNGFTLTELLIAITVIGILVGMISAALIPALKRGREASIQTEMKQMELALESFHSDYGFYPPTIGPGARIQGPDDLLPYLNRIAPNHAEATTSFPGGSQTRLEDWWDDVGQNLDERSSLAFWLSGLCKNKQYPLTGGVRVDADGLTTGVMTIAGFGVDRYSNGREFHSSVVVERDNYFELKDAQRQVGFGGAVAVYNQAYGESDGDLAYRYLDYLSYFDVGTGNPRAYYEGAVPVNVTDFINPKTYQLLTFGMDGDPGTPGNVFNVGPRGEDNLCNFANGRLDSYVNARK
jgi:prepilin-type N-terminal cleavage/methylation domain-containing protein